MGSTPSAVSQTCATPQVLLVLDRSGSMSTNLGSTGDSKFQIASNAINTVTQNFGSNGSVVFGLETYGADCFCVDPPACTQTDCVLNGDVSVPAPIPTSPAHIANALSMTTLGSGSDFLSAFDTASAEVERVIEENHSVGTLGRNTAVIFITDGIDARSPVPYCPIPDAEDLRNLPVEGFLYEVKTYVIGLGSGVDPTCLNPLAQAGGSPGFCGGASHYCPVNDQSALTQALTDAIFEIRSTVDAEVGVTESVDPVRAGGVVQFVVSVQNVCFVAATNLLVDLTLTLPPGVSVLSVDPSTGAYLAPTWTIPILGIGSTATMTLQLVVEPSAQPGVNAISLDAQVVACDQVLAGWQNDQAVEFTSIVREADLEITIADAPDPCEIGSLLTYTLTVANLGPSVSSGAEISDLLPDGVTFDASPSGCAVFADEVRCPVVGLAPGFEIDSVFSVVVGHGTPGTLVNVASVIGDDPDPTAANDTAAATTTIVPVALIFVDGFESGDTLAWTATTP